MLPLVRTLDRAPNVAQALNAFSGLPRVCLLESAKVLPTLGRYSFLMADPFAVTECHSRLENPFQRTEELLALYHAESLPDLPPFQGGAAGLLSYELGGCFEQINPAKYAEFPLPLLSLGFYDVVLVWDHQERIAWLISQGWPEVDEEARRHRAQERLDFFHQQLSVHVEPSSLELWREEPDALVAPTFKNHFSDPWQGNFTPANYRRAVARAIEYIYAGDIFQVNLSQRWIHPAVCSSLELYQELRLVNPAPFAAFIDLGATQILSASPERFLRMRNRYIETRPIKGTRLR